jgi:hypothetical protein
MSADGIHKTFFAVASLGKSRWYWVVWPSLEMHRSSEEPVQHVAEEYERSKAEAVERALKVAGMQGEWVAARYARQYHRRRRSRERQAAGAVEVLYHDVQDGATGQWRSVPHAEVKAAYRRLAKPRPGRQPRRVSGATGCLRASLAPVPVCVVSLANSLTRQPRRPGIDSSLKAGLWACGGIYRWLGWFVLPQGSLRRLAHTCNQLRRL